MDFKQTKPYSAPMIIVENTLPNIGKDTIIQSIYNGLTSTPKYISSMYFYDAIGSKLFEQITKLPEYYLTRTEMKLLKKIFGQIGETLHNTDIVEIGSGDCSKISILLDAIPEYLRETIRYIPIDVSRPAIKESADMLVKRYPGLRIHGFVANFLKQLHIIPQGKKRFICFLGSTLGNLTRIQSRRFLTGIGNIMEPDDILLLGVDMVKSKGILENAYNDSQDVTAAFNRNILNVVNNLAGSDFDPAMFKHIAYYNETFSRIEMHLQAVTEMVISSPQFPQEIILHQGEMVHTENSHKFTLDIINKLAEASGLKIKKLISDENEWFSLIMLNKSQ